MENSIIYNQEEISYSVSGKGPVVVWLHGFMEDKSIWFNQTTLFDNSYTNVCVDLLGHGSTSCVTDEELTINSYADAVIFVLDFLKIEDFSIVGHSMGGYIALFILEKRQKKINHFVLLNSTSKADTILKKENRDRALKIIEKQKDNYCRMGVVNLFSKESREIFKEEIEQLIIVAKSTPLKGVQQALLAMKNRVSKIDVLRSYSGKKMIASGINDPVLRVDEIKKESKEVGAYFVTFAGGHMSYLESFGELNSRLSDLFEGLN